MYVLLHFKISFNCKLSVVSFIVLVGFWFFLVLCSLFFAHFVHFTKSQILNNCLASVFCLDMSMFEERRKRIGSIGYSESVFLVSSSMELAEQLGDVINGTRNSVEDLPAQTVVKAIVLDKEVANQGQFCLVSTLVFGY